MFSVLADTTVAVGPIMAGLDPYITYGIGALITAAVAWALALANKFVGLKVADADVASADQYFTDLAKRAVAAAEGNLATARIDVKSSIVASLVNEAVVNGRALSTNWG